MSMKLCHAAVFGLVLVACYLMIPPTRGAPARILYRAPLSKWDLGREYESKVECEKDLKQQIKYAQYNAAHCTNGSCAITVARGAAGRCISSDDPVLKNNASIRWFLSHFKTDH